MVFVFGDYSVFSFLDFFLGALSMILGPNYVLHIFIYGIASPKYKLYLESSDSYLLLCNPLDFCFIFKASNSYKDLGEY